MFSWCTLALIIIHYLQEVGKFQIIIYFIGFVNGYFWIGVRRTLFVCIHTAQFEMTTVKIEHELEKKTVEFVPTSKHFVVCSGWNAFMPKNVYKSYYLISMFRVDFYLKKNTQYTLSRRHTVYRVSIIIWITASFSMLSFH